MSSPAMLGIKEHRDTIRDYQRAQSTMQFYNYQGDNTIHKKQYTGKRHIRTLATVLISLMCSVCLFSEDCQL